MTTSKQKKPLDTGSVFDFTPYKVKKGEDYMSQGQMEHFKAILLQWKQSLVGNMGATVTHMQDDSAHVADMNDRATQEEEFNLELKTRDRERKLIPKIDEGLKAIDLGDYGYCEECGVEIGIRRLEARPTATLCIECKTLEEARERQTGS
jgi:DnaK suppressor protein